jgi:hypothetical protein
MPCRVSSDVHEWSNDSPAVPAWNPVNPHNVAAQSTNFQRDKKSTWSFTAGCSWDVVEDAERRREPSYSALPGAGKANMEHRPSLTYSLIGRKPETTIAGQFGWGGPLLKRYREGPKVGSGGTETRRRVQGQKPA